MNQHIKKIDLATVNGYRTSVYYDQQAAMASPSIDNIWFKKEAVSCSEEKANEVFADFFKQMCDKKERYGNFVRQKGRRPVIDAYASFHAFNEATLAFLPFIEALRPSLEPGDIILDTWCRTGWTAYFLSEQFPEQKIICLWEGDKDTLGYAGFLFWLSKRKNVEIIFCDIEAGIPLADDSVKLIHGYETLHRYDLEPLLTECIRVAKKDGNIIFPHVHLTNSEPEPFFERGCKQIHGAEYQRILNSKLKDDLRAAYVFSEPELFTLKKAKPISSTPDTSDYNALVAILTAEVSSECLRVPTLHSEDANLNRIILNPLLRFDLHRKRIFIDKDNFDGVVGHLLERHPVYSDFISPYIDYELSDETTEVLFWAQRHLSIAEISEKTNLSCDHIGKVISPLLENKAAQLLRLDEASHRFYHFMSTQEYVEPIASQTIQHLWSHALLRYRDQTLITCATEEVEYTYEEIAVILESIEAKLIHSGVSKGEKICVYSTLKLEAVLVAWACLKLGLVLVPLNQEISGFVAGEIIHKLGAKLVFVDEQAASKLDVSLLKKCVCFDGDESQDNADNLSGFSDWLETEVEEEFELPKICAEDPAVILYTTGSTSQPKGVILSHGALYRSARNITESFHWGVEDRYLALGNMDIMSGLRNCLIAPLEVGASIVLPGEDNQKNFFKLVEQIETYEVTILSSHPPFLRLLDKHSDRIRASIRHLRQMLSSGSALCYNLKTSLFSKFEIPIYDYYGLTETSGICITESVGEPHSENAIGRPVGCIAQVLRKDGSLADFDEQGELRIYSENALSAYTDAESIESSMNANGWFYTKDIVKMHANASIEWIGRGREFIKAPDGSMIFLHDLEAAVRNMDAVEDICLYAKEQPDSREYIAAAIVTNHSEPAESDALKKSIQNEIAYRFDGRIKISELVHFDSLPYAENGKVRKSEIRKHFFKQD